MNFKTELKELVGQAIADGADKDDVRTALNNAIDELENVPDEEEMTDEDDSVGTAAQDKGDEASAEA